MKQNTQNRVTMESQLSEKPSGEKAAGDRDSVEKRIIYTYSIILRAKIRNFLKKSLLKYTIASLIYAAGMALVRGRALLSAESAFVFINFFLIFLSLSFIFMFISSWILERKFKGWSMIYTFSARGIHVRNEKNGQVEDHGWEWISAYQLTDRTLFLTIRSVKPFEIILDRDKLSLKELALLQGWLESAG